MQLEVRFNNKEALIDEFDRNLCHGGTFVRGESVFEERDEVELVILHPLTPDKLVFRANVVWVVDEGEEPGVGVAISNFTPSDRDSIKDFIHKKPKPAASSARASRDLTHTGVSIQQRLRNLNSSDQRKVAMGKNANDRIQLERIYGRTVWEPILRNPSVTVPEVARIARMGTLPQPLFEIIGENNALIRVPQIRRALLANPKTPATVVDKVLRVAPRSELKLIPKQTAYSHVVREKAKKLLN